MSAWRDLQLQILEAAKQRRRTSALWDKMDDAFWVESDLAVLGTMIEQVIDHLENA